MPALFRYRKGMTGEAHQSEGYREPCEVTSLEDGDGLTSVHLACFMWDQVFTPAYEIPHSEHAVRIPGVGDMVTVSMSTLGDDVGGILLHNGSRFFPEIHGMSFEWVGGVCPHEEVLLPGLGGRSPEVVVAERIALDVTHETGTVRLFAGESATVMQPSSGDRFLVGVRVAYCIEDPEGPDADSDCPRRRQAYHIGRLE